MALAGTVQAAETSKQKDKRRSAQARSAYEAPRNSERSRSDLEPAWYPHDSSALPFGSKLWWDQKNREGGGSRD